MMARHADQIKSIVLIAPACYPVNRPCIAKCGNAPLIGSCITTAFGGRVYTKAVKEHFFINKQNGEAYQEAVNRVTKSIKLVPAYMPSIASTSNNFLSNSNLDIMAKLYKECGKRPNITPVCMVWGNKDVTTPYYPNAELMRYVIIVGDDVVVLLVLLVVFELIGIDVCVCVCVLLK